MGTFLFDLHRADIFAHPAGAEPEHIPEMVGGSGQVLGVQAFRMDWELPC